MKCEQALERMLDADIDELEGQGQSDVAMHVRTCARCGAVARRILLDSASLATAIASPVDVKPITRVPRQPRRLVVGAGVTSIAASLMVAVLVQYSMKDRVTEIVNASIDTASVVDTGRDVGGSVGGSDTASASELTRMNAGPFRPVAFTAAESIAAADSFDSQRNALASGADSDSFAATSCWAKARSALSGNRSEYRSLCRTPSDPEVRPSPVSSRSR